VTKRLTISFQKHFAKDKQTTKLVINNVNLRQRD